MAQLTGQNDEQFAAGAVIGGTANVLASTAVGHSATTAATWIAAHCGGLSAVKSGILLAMNPHLGVIALCGGIGYICYKMIK